MRTLFYNICEAITESITGLTNGELKLWELGEYLRVYDRVELIMNLIVAAGLLCLAYVCIDVMVTLYKLINKKLFKARGTV